MKFRAHAIILFCLLAFLVSLPANAVRKHPRAKPATHTGTLSIEAQADAMWREGSFRRALMLYRQALKQGKPLNPDLARLRVAAANVSLGRFNTGVQQGLQLLNTTPGKARVLYWLGRAYAQADHGGYKFKGALHRGYPESLADAEEDQVEYLDLTRSDIQKTLDFFETAKLHAAQERAAHAHNALTADEEIDLNFDLATWLPKVAGGRFIRGLAKGSPAAFDETIDLKLPYSRDWSLPKKVLFLYNEIRRLDNSPAKLPTARALLAKGSFADTYRANMDFWALPIAEKKVFAETRPQGVSLWNLDKPAAKRPALHFRRYPFRYLNPVAIWTQPIREFPRGPYADSTLLLIANWQMRHDEPGQALQTYRRVVREYPKSPRVGNARQAISQLTLSSIEFRSGKPQPLGKNAKITLQTHNTPLLRFTAYRVRLESLFKSFKQTDGDSDTLQKAISRLGPLTQLQRRLGSPVKKWTLRTGDRNDYRHVRQTVAIPLSQNGAYLVVAEARGVHYARPVLVTDLALVKKLDRSSTLFYAADARTGKPVGNINVLVTEVRRTRAGVRKFQTLGKTDANGFYTGHLLPNTASCQALAWIGNRYAYTGAQVFSDWQYGYETESQAPQNSVYSYTDRPIYRPGQKVYYREIVTHRDDNGIHTPIKNRKVRVSIRREGSSDIFLVKAPATSSFGTVNGSFTLPKTLRLGTYAIQTQIESTRKIGARSYPYWEDIVGGGTFRVEEYKRPEFVVTLTPPTTAARPGDTIRAKVSVRYYTGGAVPNARVKWHVERSQWRASHHFPTAFDWLSDQWSDTPNYYGTSSYRSPNNKVKPKRDGTVVTNAKGEAEIIFVTDKDHFCDSKPDDWTDNLTNPSYSISAEVTDSSRRAVQAAGETRVSAQRYFAFLQPERGFTTAGSAVQIDLAARNANDQPVAASGRITVYREESVPAPQPDSPYEPRAAIQKPAETSVHAENLTIDETGLAYWNWTPDNAGYFRIAYEGQDNDGHNIVASTFVWVSGNGMDTRPIANKGLAIAVEKLSYEEGDTARVLLVCDKPDATVLLTQETGTKILRKQIVTLKGKSAIVEMPIRRSHAPNFVIAAVAVNDYQVFRAAAAVVVPNTRSSLQINVESDKETYKPGEKGVFTITALDRDGAPARAEVSLALTDASLYALEGDNAPDMMAFYFGNLRTTSVFADSFLSANYPARGERDGKFYRYRSWNLNLPRDFGQLHIGAEDYTYLIRSSSYDNFERANYFPEDQSDITYWQLREEIEQNITLSRPGQALYPVFGIEPRCEEEPERTWVPKEDDFRTMSLMDAITTLFGSPRRVQTVFNVANNALSTSAGKEADYADGRVDFLYKNGDSGLAGSPAPMPAMIPREARVKSRQEVGGPASVVLHGLPALAPAQLRSNFAETAFWAPAVVTENGKAKVEVTFPDTLTEWHAGARGLTEQVQVGAGERNVVTNKSLRVRLQSPRFFTQRDHVLLTANISNDLKTDKHIKVSLQTASNLQVMPQSSSQWGTTLPSASGFVDVKAGSEATVNWLVNVVRPGTASVQMTAQSDEESDAVKMSFPVVVHGASRFESSSGVMGPAASAKPLSKTVRFTMPAARQKGASRLVVQVNPSIAATMLDAIPYLADYPYGCVEQTMSRFLPAAAAQGALQRNGVNLQELKQRIQHEASASRTAAAASGVQNTGYSYPRGVPGARDASQLARDWSNPDRSKNPVYDPVVLRRMVHEGLERLAQMQRGDGGWGWWPDSPESDDYMTAYVVSGLQILRQQQISIIDVGRLRQLSERGVRYLRNVMHREANQRETDWEMVAQYAYAIAQAGQPTPSDTKLIAGRLFQLRAKLTPYSQAMLAFSLATIGEKAKAAVLIRNMENTVKVDNATGTARWMTNNNEWWQWWNNGVETNALALRAFLKADPHNKLTPMLMKWLLVQARGGHWRSTKETALAVLALADYVKVNRELDVDCTVTVRLGDRLQRTFRITRTNALTFDNRFIADDSLLADGANTLNISVKGKGRVYWNVSREYFSLEEPIRASGSQLSIARRYFKISEAGGKRWRIPLKDGDALRSGDHVEVELAIHSANTFDYLVFEDMKPAGLEAIEVHSGSHWNGDLVSNIEWRDDKVALFLDSLPPGNHTLRYEMRAEVPGNFHALPTNGYAMYAPEVRATSQEMRLGIHDVMPQ